MVIAGAAAAAIEGNGRAFAVLWRDLERWVIPASVLLRSSLHPGWTRVKIGTLVTQVNTRIKIDAESEYKMAGVKWYGEGIFHRETVRGDGMSASQVTPLIPNAVVYNRLFAWKASFAVVTPEFKDCYVSNEFPQFTLDVTRILPEYLYLFFTRDATIRAVNAASTGSAAVSRNRFKEDQFLNFEIPLPPLNEQLAIVGRWHKAHLEIASAHERVEKLNAAISSRFLSDVGLTGPSPQKQPRAFAAWWKDVDRWGVQMIALNAALRKDSTFQEVRLSELCRIGSGGTPPRGRADYFGGSIPWVKTTEVRNNIITSTEETITEEGLKNSSAKIYPKGSLLIAMYGQGATRGRTAKLGIDAATNQACAVLFDIAPKIQTDYLWYYLISQYEAMRAMASGNNQPNMNAKMVNNLRIPLPPITIQNQIIKRMAKGRAEVAREQEFAVKLTETINADIENLILGTKTLTGN
jgi:type I restriction enzyme, S subunit